MSNFKRVSLLLLGGLLFLGVMAVLGAPVRADAGKPAEPLPLSYQTYLPIVRGGKGGAVITPTLRAGLRASSYGIEPFPASGWWITSTRQMAGYVPGSAPAVIWIVGVIQESDNACQLNFPAPATGGPYEHILFDSEDFNESYLQAFDAQGMQVWLQVEPGVADIGTLVDLILDRYGRHPSVIGVGVDVEWYRNDVNPDGKPVTNAEAQAWVTRIRAHNPNGRLFLKHWETAQMPSTYRDGVVFIDDSQTLDDLDAMVAEFKVWGQTFSPAPVGFQFGYRGDRPWWVLLNNPPRTITQALHNAIPNATDFYWVDFTAREIWPTKN